MARRPEWIRARKRWGRSDLVVHAFGEMISLGAPWCRAPAARWPGRWNRGAARWADGGGEFIVEQTAQRVGAGAQLHAADVADTRNLSVFGGAHDNVAEFFFGGEAALGVHQN